MIKRRINQIILLLIIVFFIKCIDTKNPTILKSDDSYFTTGSNWVLKNSAGKEIDIQITNEYLLSGNNIFEFTTKVDNKELSDRYYFASKQQKIFFYALSSKKETFVKMLSNPVVIVDFNKEDFSDKTLYDTSTLSKIDTKTIKYNETDYEAIGIKKSVPEIVTSGNEFKFYISEEIGILQIIVGDEEYNLEEFIIEPKSIGLPEDVGNPKIIKVIKEFYQIAKKFENDQNLSDFVDLFSVEGFNQLNQNKQKNVSIIRKIKEEVSDYFIFREDELVYNMEFIITREDKIGLLTPFNVRLNFQLIKENDKILIKELNLKEKNIFNIQLN